MTRQRVLLIVIIAALIFGGLLGARLIYQNRWLDAGILRQSQQIPGVLSAKIVNRNGQDEMVVTTNQISNLRKVSQALEKIAGDLPIRYLDPENDTLNKLFDQMQFAIQEGIMRGNFTMMDQNLNSQAKKAGVRLQLQIDSEAIYVVLDQGNAQLVQVISRNGQARFLPSEKE